MNSVFEMKFEIGTIGINTATKNAYVNVNVLMIKIN